MQQAAQACSLAFTIQSSLISGVLGSLGFFINMFVIGGIMYLWRNRKTIGVTDTARKVVADMLTKK